MKMKPFTKIRSNNREVISRTPNVRRVLIVLVAVCTFLSSWSIRAEEGDSKTDAINEYKNGRRFIVKSVNPNPEKLATISVYQRKANEFGVYISLTYEKLPGSTTDAFCFEGGTVFRSARAIDGGAVELTYDLEKHPGVKMILTVTPEAGAVILEARYVADEGREIPEGLFTSGMCNLCYKFNNAFAAAPPPEALFYDSQAHYTDYVKHCFIYTPSGVMSMGDTKRFRIPEYPEDDRVQKPFPWIQAYYGVNQVPAKAHEKWTSSDRYTKTVLGCRSVNGKYLIGLGSDSAGFLFQGWGCLHNPAEWLPLDGKPEERRWKIKVYFMENDPQKLLETATKDFPGLKNQPEDLKNR